MKELPVRQYLLFFCGCLQVLPVRSGCKRRRLRRQVGSARGGRRRSRWGHPLPAAEHRSEPRPQGQVRDRTCWRQCVNHQPPERHTLLHSVGKHSAITRWETTLFRTSRLEANGSSVKINWGRINLWMSIVNYPSVKSVTKRVGQYGRSVSETERKGCLIV